jgi:hypothetical protein
VQTGPRQALTTVAGAFGRPGATRRALKLGLTNRDLRRAIVMNEVLGKPIALREDSGPLW